MLVPVLLSRAIPLAGMTQRIPPAYAQQMLQPPPTPLLRIFFLEKAILAPPLGGKINILDVCFVWVPSDSVLLKSFVGLKVSDLHCLLLQYCDGEK